MATTKTPEVVELAPEQRDALTKELFAYWKSAAPEAHHCFCGSDKDLLEAVTELRAERERARDDDEIGG